MKIRQEERKDYGEVYKLIREAFKTAEHADGNEQDLAEALRESRAFVPELSLVAEEHGEIIGHILFTEAKVGEDTVLALAPLSVKPGYQRQGVGAALIRQGHKLPENWDIPGLWSSEAKPIIPNSAMFLQRKWGSRFRKAFLLLTLWRPDSGKKQIR